MNRIKIDLPEHFYFSTMLSIRITDINYGGHVGNDSFLSLIHEARQQFLLSHGYKELDIEGFGLIMADVAIEYKKELSHRDQVKISVAADGFDKLGFDIFYRIELIENEALTLAGKAKTGMMGFDYATKKKMAIPTSVINKLSAG
ncbi:thioesterase [Sediminibacterium roseum]|uniref:Thioesterase n=1 Tax=Sediminibacterium roseum TaxID=1978412 RepID=A0ABW9ZQA6_9BACT|nr:thioesterase family protein [Sediminibacterium roseum]NCI49255.1 thioesterase [Sediminibacterium roseum]